MQTFTTGWYVMYTKPRHEKQVTRQLELLEINSYLPTIKTLRKWADRKKYVVMPLFPSYVFVNLENC
jgi:transcription antitermination factor NusG